MEASGEATRAIGVLVASISTAAEAAEIVGARYAREVSLTWSEPVAAEILDAWRKRIAGQAFLRWESAVRERIVEDAIFDASRHLEDRAAKLGVRLVRSARDMICERTRRAS
jgi:hypothetical protein